jgi:hypothetical protein
MKIGDMIIKEGDSDAGQAGVVLEINTNILGHKFIKALTSDGKIKIWYAKLVRNIDSSYMQN